jgi:hypothetical protein
VARNNEPSFITRYAEGWWESKPGEIILDQFTAPMFSEFLMMVYDERMASRTTWDAPEKVADCHKISGK